MEKYTKEEKKQQVGKRISYAIEKLGITDRQFALKIGVDPSQLSKILSGKLGLTHEKAVSIRDNFPIISVGWILEGEEPEPQWKKVPHETVANEKIEGYHNVRGIAIIETNHDVSSFLKEKEGSNAKSIGTPVGTYRNKAGNDFIELSGGSYYMVTPLVTKKAYAGYLTGWGDEEYISELPKHLVPVDKPHSGEYISIEVTGQSMNDGTERSFLPGDIPTGRKINRKLWRDSKLHLKSYKEFIIVHKNGILLKSIIDHNVIKNTITIHSYNPDKEAYPDEVLKLEDVIQIFNVVKNTQNRSNK